MHKIIKDDVHYSAALDVGVDVEEDIWLDQGDDEIIISQIQFDQIVAFVNEVRAKKESG